MKFVGVLALIAFSCHTASALNVLYLSTIPSPSHFIWCKSILTSLHNRGYNITALSPDVEESKENFSYYHLEKIYPALYNGTTEINYFEMGQMSMIEMYLEFTGWIKNICIGTLNSKGYQQLLDFPDDFKFDLIVYDFTFSQCLLALVHKFKYPPMISVSPFMFSGKSTLISGSLMFPAFYPTPDSEFSQKMDFKERVISMMQSIFEIAIDKLYFIPKSNQLVHQRHPEIPHITDIERKATKLILMNTQSITDYKQPAFAHVKLVGGAQIQKPKQLPAELKSIVDAATKGVILFSLGTNVRSDTLGSERILKIIKAFARLDKYTFLWKFETKEKLPIELPKNVKIQPWIPQNDILSHKNTKLFISHCGLLSSQEALWYGVPVLGFPVFADQVQNAPRLKNLGVSETLSIIDFTEEELYETIKKLLEDPKYLKNIKSISSALRDQPMTPLEEATYWIEWVLRHPEIDLSSPSMHLNLFQRHSLDVFLLFLVIVIFTILIWAKIIKLLIRLLSKRKNLSVNDKKKKN